MHLTIYGNRWLTADYCVYAVGSVYPNYFNQITFYSVLFSNSGTSEYAIYLKNCGHINFIECSAENSTKAACINNCEDITLQNLRTNELKSLVKFKFSGLCRIMMSGGGAGYNRSFFDLSELSTSSNITYIGEVNAIDSTAGTMVSTSMALTKNGHVYAQFSRITKLQ